MENINIANQFGMTIAHRCAVEENLGRSGSLTIVSWKPKPLKTKSRNRGYKSPECCKSIHWYERYGFGCGISLRTSASWVWLSRNQNLIPPAPDSKRMLRRFLVVGPCLHQVTIKDSFFLQLRIHKTPIKSTHTRLSVLAYRNRYLPPKSTGMNNMTSTAAAAAIGHQPMYQINCCECIIITSISSYLGIN